MHSLRQRNAMQLAWYCPEPGTEHVPGALVNMRAMRTLMMCCTQLSSLPPTWPG